MVASSLDIPIHFAALDDEKWFDGWNREGFNFPEPLINFALWNGENSVRKAAWGDGIRVFYRGWGPDFMLNEPTRYATLLRHGLVDDFVRLACDFMMRYRRRPRAAVRQFWQRVLGILPVREVEVDGLALLAPSIAEHVDIPTRWWQFPTRPRMHAWRPQTYSSVTDPYWVIGFQQEDAAYWDVPLEFRYPYFDIRLVRYLLRVPVVPGFSNKRLLREVMRGKLPEMVRLRPKATLAGKPKHLYADWVCRSNRPGPELARYVDTSRLARLIAEPVRSERKPMEHCLIALNRWLQCYKEQLGRSQR